MQNISDGNGSVYLEFVEEITWYPDRRPAITGPSYRWIHPRPDRTKIWFDDLFSDYFLTEDGAVRQDVTKQDLGIIFSADRLFKQGGKTQDLVMKLTMADGGRPNRRHHTHGPWHHPRTEMRIVLIRGCDVEEVDSVQNDLAEPVQLPNWLQQKPQASSYRAVDSQHFQSSFDTGYKKGHSAQKKFLHVV